MIITSMNLYEFSEKNNREMGVLINKAQDAQIYEDGVQESRSIIAASKKVSSGQDKPVEENVLPQAIRPDIDECFDKKNIHDYLLKTLLEKYPNHNFVYEQRGNLISCEQFIIPNITVQVEPGDYRWRIDIRLTHKDYSAKRLIYDYFFVAHRQSIESMFPANSINWGSQMKRIKVDIYINEHVGFFLTNKSAVEGTLKCLELVETEIVSKVESFTTASLPAN